jgi:four helix bundle protein
LEGRSEKARRGKGEGRMRTAATSFEDLIVWQKAHQFVLAVYRLSRMFPGDEIYGLSSQFRRAAVSIAANIAEGFRKRGKADKLRFYNISQGSAEESRYYLILTRDLEYGDISEPERLLDEVSKLLSVYSRTIRNSCP